MSFTLLSVAAGLISFLILSVILIVLGVCPGAVTSDPLSNQVNIKFGDPGSSPRRVGAKRRNVVPNINPQKSDVVPHEKTNTGVSNQTLVTKIPKPTNGPITPNFTKLRKGTGFDTESFENDLDMAINDLSGDKATASKQTEEETIVLPPPPELTASMKNNDYKPPPTDDTFPPAPPPPTSSFISVDIAPPPPPPEDNVTSAPSKADIENALSQMPRLSDVDLVPLHELEIDMADERTEEAKPKEKYIGGLRNRAKSIFRPSKQYLIEQGTNPEDIKTLPRHKKKLPKLNVSDGKGTIDKKL